MKKINLKFVCASIMLLLTTMITQPGLAQQNQKQTASPKPQPNPYQARPSQPQTKSAQPIQQRNTNVQKNTNPYAGTSDSQFRTNQAQEREKYNQQYNSKKSCYTKRTANGQSQQICN